MIQPGRSSPYCGNMWRTYFCLWPPYGIGQAIIFSSCSFFLSSSSVFSSPNLGGRRLDVCHTSTHGVALVRILNAGLKPAARGSLQIQDPKKSPKIAIWAPWHNFVGLYLGNQGTYRQSEKKFLSSNISCTCPHNMVNFGLLAAEILSLVWGTPGDFNGFRVLAALLHGNLVAGVSQTAAFNRGRHLYSAGRP